MELPVAGSLSEKLVESHVDSEAPASDQTEKDKSPYLFMKPSCGPCEGGTLVSIFGQKFRFGDVRVRIFAQQRFMTTFEGTWISDSELQIQMPAYAGTKKKSSDWGTVSIYISLCGSPFESLPGDFRYHLNCTALDLRPLAIPLPQDVRAVDKQNIDVRIRAMVKNKFISENRSKWAKSIRGQESWWWGNRWLDDLREQDVRIAFVKIDSNYQLYEESSDESSEEDLEHFENASSLDDDYRFSCTVKAKLVEEFTSKETEAGFAWLSCAIPSELETGKYSVTVSLNGQQFGPTLEAVAHREEFQKYADNIRAIHQLHVFARPRLLEYSPPVCHVFGGQPLKIRGQNLYGYTADQKVLIRFSQKNVFGKEDVYSIEGELQEANQVVVCKTCRFDSPGWYAVAVSTNGGCHFFNADQGLLVYLEPVCRSIYPLFTSSSGGCSLSLRIVFKQERFYQREMYIPIEESVFHDAGCMLVRFIVLTTKVTLNTVKARWSDDRRSIECQVPRNPDVNAFRYSQMETMDIQLAIDGIHFVTLHPEAPFNYFPTPRITAMTMHHVPFTEKTKLKINLQHHVPDTMVCKVRFVAFDEEQRKLAPNTDLVRVRAKSISQIRIQEPEKPRNEFLSFLEADSINRMKRDKKQLPQIAVADATIGTDGLSLECFIPRWRWKNENQDHKKTQVEISYNGIEFSNEGNPSSSEFIYYRQPRITAIEPTCCEVFRSRRLVIKGTNLIANGAASRVLFYNDNLTKIVDAEIVDDNLQCIAPDLAAGEWKVGITFHNFQFSGMLNDDNRKDRAEAVKILFYDAPDLSFASPNCGPTKGGTNITICGSGLIETNQIFLKFSSPDHDFVKLVRGHAKDNMIICKSPSVPEKIRVKIECALNGIDYARSHIFFQYYDRFVLRSVSPHRCLRTTPMAMHIHVTGLVPSTTCSGRLVFPIDLNPLSSQSTKTSKTSGTKAQRMTRSLEFPVYVVEADDPKSIRVEFPPVSCYPVERHLVPYIAAIHMKKMYLELSLDGQNYTPVAGNLLGTNMLTLYPEPTVANIDPPCGPWTGGTKVTFAGRGFCNTKEISIRMTDEDGVSRIVHGNYINSRTISCISPTWDPAIIKWKEKTSTSGSTQNPSIPLIPVTIEMSLCNNQFFNIVGYRSIIPDYYLGEESQDMVLNSSLTGLKANFYYYKDPVLCKLSTASGPTEGGTILRIHGHGFQARCAPYYRVNFGHQYQTPARFFNSDLIECIAPKTIEGKYRIHVSMNGQQFSSLSEREGLTNSFQKKKTIKAVSLAVRIIRKTKPAPTPRKKSAALWSRLASSKSSLITAEKKATSSKKLVRETSEKVVEKPEAADHLYFQSYRAPRLKSMHQMGPNDGGTEVIIRGEGFIASEQVTVRFRSATRNWQATVPAQLQGPTTIVCESPPAFSFTGLSYIEVSPNNQQFVTHSNCIFEYFEVPHVEFLDPSNWSCSESKDEDQHTLRIHLMSRNCIPMSVQAQQVDRCLLLFRTTASKSSVKVPASIDGNILECEAPRSEVPVDYHIFISFDHGVHFHETDGIVCIHKVPRGITEIIPAFAPLDSGTTIHILGDEWINTNCPTVARFYPLVYDTSEEELVHYDEECFFDVVGEFVENYKSGALKYELPDVDLDYHRISYRYDVQVSLNGYDFFDSASAENNSMSLFEFYPSPIIQGISPAFAPCNTELELTLTLENFRYYERKKDATDLFHLVRITEPITPMIHPLSGCFIMMEGFESADDDQQKVHIFPAEIVPPTPGTEIDNVLLKARLQTFATPCTMHLRLSLNHGHQYSTAEFEYSFYIPPFHVDQLTFGQEGGASVNVYGEDSLMKLLQIHKMFTKIRLTSTTSSSSGHLITPKTVATDPPHLRFTTPATATPGDYLLDIVMSGHNNQLRKELCNETHVHILPTPILRSCTPSCLPLDSSLKFIDHMRITGEKFTKMQHFILVRFQFTAVKTNEKAQFIVHAKFISSGELSCEIPPLPTILQAFTGDSSDGISGIIDISMNQGFEYSSSKLHFSFYHPDVMNHLVVQPQRHASSPAQDPQLITYRLNAEFSLQVFPLNHIFEFQVQSLERKEQPPIVIPVKLKSATELTFESDAFHRVGTYRVEVTPNQLDFCTVGTIQCHEKLRLTKANPRWSCFNYAKCYQELAAAPRQHRPLQQVVKIHLPEFASDMLRSFSTADLQMRCELIQTSKVLYMPVEIEQYQLEFDLPEFDHAGEIQICLCWNKLTLSETQPIYTFDPLRWQIHSWFPKSFLIQVTDNEIRFNGSGFSWTDTIQLSLQNPETRQQFHLPCKVAAHRGIRLVVEKAANLLAMDLHFSDPFVILNYNNQTLTTSVIQRTLNPIWNEEFQILLDKYEYIIDAVVEDKDWKEENDFLGRFQINLREDFKDDGKWHSKTYQLLAEDGVRVDCNRGYVHVRGQWIPDIEVPGPVNSELLYVSAELPRIDQVQSFDVHISPCTGLVFPDKYTLQLAELPRNVQVNPSIIPWSTGATVRVVAENWAPIDHYWVRIIEIINPLKEYVVLHHLEGTLSSSQTLECTLPAFIRFRNPLNDLRLSISMDKAHYTSPEASPPISLFRVENIVPSIGPLTGTTPLHLCCYAPFDCTNIQPFVRFTWSGNKQAISHQIQVTAALTTHDKLTRDQELLFHEREDILQKKNGRHLKCFECLTPALPKLVYGAKKEPKVEIGFEDMTTKVMSRFSKDGLEFAYERPPHFKAFDDSKLSTQQQLRQSNCLFPGKSIVRCTGAHLIENHNFYICLRRGLDAQHPKQSQVLSKTWTHARTKALCTTPNEIEFTVPRSNCIGAESFILPSKYSNGKQLKLWTWDTGIHFAVGSVQLCYDSVSDKYDHKEFLLSTGFSPELQRHKPGACLRSHVIKPSKPPAAASTDSSFLNLNFQETFHFADIRHSTIDIMVEMVEEKQQHRVAPSISGAPTTAKTTSTPASICTRVGLSHLNLYQVLENVEPFEVNDMFIWYQKLPKMSLTSIPVAAGSPGAAVGEIDCVDIICVSKADSLELALALEDEIAPKSSRRRASTFVAETLGLSLSTYHHQHSCTFDISLNGLDYSRSSHSVTSFTPVSPFLREISPTYASSNTKSDISLRGFHFQSVMSTVNPYGNEKIQLLFYQLIPGEDGVTFGECLQVEGEVISDTLIQCQLPALTSLKNAPRAPNSLFRKDIVLRDFQIAISMNSLDYVHPFPLSGPENLTFHVYPPPIFSAINSVDGKFTDELRLKGSGFIETRTIKIKFAAIEDAKSRTDGRNRYRVSRGVIQPDVIVDGTYIDDETLTCFTPNSFALFTLVEVSIALNGLDYNLACPKPIRVQNAPTLEDPAPSLYSAFGGTILRIKGSNLLETGNIEVRFLATYYISTTDQQDAPAGSICTVERIVPARCPGKYIECLIPSFVSTEDSEAHPHFVTNVTDNNFADKQKMARVISSKNVIPLTAFASQEKISVQVSARFYLDDEFQDQAAVNMQLYGQIPLIQRIRPKSGSVWGGWKLHLQVKHLLSTELLCVRFARYTMGEIGDLEAAVPAKVTKPDEMVIITPRCESAMSKSENKRNTDRKQYMIQVSLNGIEYSSFQYELSIDLWERWHERHRNPTRRNLFAFHEDEQQRTLSNQILSKMQKRPESIPEKANAKAEVGKAKDLPKLHRSSMASPSRPPRRLLQRQKSEATDSISQEEMSFLQTLISDSSTTSTSLRQNSMLRPAGRKAGGQHSRESSLSTGASGAGTPSEVSKLNPRKPDDGVDLASVPSLWPEVSARNKTVPSFEEHIECLYSDVITRTKLRHVFIRGLCALSPETPRSKFKEFLAKVQGTKAKNLGKISERAAKADNIIQQERRKSVRRQSVFARNRKASTLESNFIDYERLSKLIIYKLYPLARPVQLRALWDRIDEDHLGFASIDQIMQAFSQVQSNSLAYTNAQGEPPGPGHYNPDISRLQPRAPVVQFPVSPRKLSPEEFQADTDVRPAVYDYDDRVVRERPPSWGIGKATIKFGVDLEGRHWANVETIETKLIAEQLRLDRRHKKAYFNKHSRLLVRVKTENTMQIGNSMLCRPSIKMLPAEDEPSEIQEETRLPEITNSDTK